MRQQVDLFDGAPEFEGMLSMACGVWFAMGCGRPLVWRWERSE